MALPDSTDNDSYETEKFCLKKIYDGYLYKFHYNPLVTDLNQLKFVLEELKLNIEESNLNYNLLHQFLTICKDWFASSPCTRTFYKDFIHHIQKEMKLLAVSKFKDKNEEKIIKPLCTKIVSLDLEVPKNDKKGRFVVTVDCRMSQLGSITMDYSNLPDVKALIDKAPLWSHPPLTVRSMVNWPYVGFILHLPDVSIAHYATPTFHRCVRLADCEEDLKIEKENCLKLTQGFDNRVGLQCKVDNLILYLCLCRQAVYQLEEVSTRRKEELSIIVETILRALSHCKSKSCSVNLECSYASTKYKLIRERNITDGDNNTLGSLKKKPKNDKHGSSKNGTSDKLVEVMTPIFKFNITRCLFKYQTAKMERDRIKKYFSDILKKRDDKKVESFIKTMRKDISYLCGYCNAIYNDDTFYCMEKHIHKMHGSEEPWTCMGCNVQFDAYEMSMHNWRHDCK